MFEYSNCSCSLHLKPSATISRISLFAFLRCSIHSFVVDGKASVRSYIPFSCAFFNILEQSCPVCNIIRHFFNILFLSCLWEGNSQLAMQGVRIYELVVPQLNLLGWDHYQVVRQAYVCSLVTRVDCLRWMRLIVKDFSCRFCVTCLVLLDCIMRRLGDANGWCWVPNNCSVFRSK